MMQQQQDKLSILDGESNKKRVVSALNSTQICIHPNVLHSVTFLILILEDSTMDPDIRKYIDEGCALNSEYFQDETYAYTDVSFSRHELWAL